MEILINFLNTCCSIYNHFTFTTFPIFVFVPLLVLATCFAAQKVAFFLVKDCPARPLSKLFLWPLYGTVIFLLSKQFYYSNVHNPLLPYQFLCSFLFLITIITDAATLMISRFVTLYALPLIFLLHFYYGPTYTFIGFYESLFAALTGYGILWGTNAIARIITGNNGIGEGDFDFLALIGATTGFFGCWTSLLIGSCIGSFYGITQLLLGKSSSELRLAFGTFLAMGALLVLFYQDMLYRFLTTFSLYL